MSDATPQHTPRHDRYRLLARWLVLLGALLYGITFFCFAIYGMLYEKWVEEIAKEHFAATVGLPCAALAAVFLVVILEIQHGKVELKIWQLEFKGAAGPIIMWVVSFSTIALAIRLLW